MIKIIKTVFLIAFITTALISCKKDSATTTNTEVVDLKPIPEVEEQAVQVKQEPKDFIPKGYIVFDTIYGDLNKDGLEDCALIIKGTDKSKVITHEYRGQLDRNRRGIIVLLNTKNGYELVVKNYNCFSSENEDGGVYFAPELGVEISKGKLYVNYAHGRYGYWCYTFRQQNNDLELIGYDASENHGPMVLYVTSINFLTRQKIEKENTDRDYDPEKEEVFVETKTKIARSKLLKLSEIKDFDEFDSIEK